MDDPTQYLRFAAALIFVLALIGAIAFVARAFGFLTPMQRKSGERRLSVIEILSLDPRRRLVLVRRDDKEHLILLSSTDETVVESGIAVKDMPDVPISGSTFLTIKTEPRLCN